jgi:hypothetical protein
LYAYLISPILAISATRLNLLEFTVLTILVTCINHEAPYYVIF